MNLIRKYKISKLINKPLEGVESDAINFMKKIADNVIPFKYSEYPNSIFYMNNNGEWVFEQHNKADRFYVRYDFVWKILEINFSMTNEEINPFIKFMVEEAFKSKISKPLPKEIKVLHSVEDAYKKVSVPIADDSNTMNSLLKEAFQKQNENEDNFNPLFLLYYNEL